jgi:hypothetical protein
MADLWEKRLSSLGMPAELPSGPVAYGHEMERYQESQGLLAQGYNSGAPAECVMCNGPLKQPMLPQGGGRAVRTCSNSCKCKLERLRAKMRPNRCGGVEGAEYSSVAKGRR